MARLSVFVLTMLAAFPAVAHDLRVFAFVEGDTVNVEARFSTGRVPVGGQIRVLDAREVLLETYEIDPGGVTSFPLSEGAAEGGLMIEVEVGDGHEDYWMLTPDDIARGQEGS